MKLKMEENDTKLQFQKFLNLVQKITDNDVEVLKLIEKRHKRANGDFLVSDEFNNLIKSVKTKIRKDPSNPYIPITEFVTELKRYEKKKIKEPRTSGLKRPAQSSDTDSLPDLKRTRRVQTQILTQEENDPNDQSDLNKSKQIQKELVKDKENDHHKDKHEGAKMKSISPFKNGDHVSSIPEDSEIDALGDHESKCKRRKKNNRNEEKKNSEEEGEEDEEEDKENGEEEASTSDGRKKQKASDKQIHRLEELLKKISDEIQNLQEVELSLDDMAADDTVYTLEDRYKKKFVKVWNKLCELKGCQPLTGRRTEKKFKYEGTRYPGINRKISKFINTNNLFPDYHDIMEIISRCNIKYHLHLGKKMIESLAKDAFTEVGNKLQKRRLEDFSADFGCQLTENFKSYRDPALFDKNLRRQLDKNRETCKTKMEEVINKYAHKQDRMDETSSEDEEEEEEDRAEEEQEEKEESDVIKELQETLGDEVQVRPNVKVTRPRSFSTLQCTAPVDVVDIISSDEDEEEEAEESGEEESILWNPNDFELMVPASSLEEWETEVPCDTDNTPYPQKGKDRTTTHGAELTKALPGNISMVIVPSDEDEIQAEEKENRYNSDTSASDMEMIVDLEESEEEKQTPITTNKGHSRNANNLEKVIPPSLGEWQTEVEEKPSSAKELHNSKQNAAVEHEKTLLPKPFIEMVIDDIPTGEEQNVKDIDDTDIVISSTDMESVPDDVDQEKVSTEDKAKFYQAKADLDKKLHNPDVVQVILSQDEDKEATGKAESEKTLHNPDDVVQVITSQDEERDEGKAKVDKEFGNPDDVEVITTEDEDRNEGKAKVDKELGNPDDVEVITTEDEDRNEGTATVDKELGNPDDVEVITTEDEDRNEGKAKVDKELGNPDDVEVITTEDEDRNEGKAKVDKELGNPDDVEVITTEDEDRNEGKAKVDKELGNPDDVEVILSQDEDKEGTTGKAEGEKLHNPDDVEVKTSQDESTGKHMETKSKVTEKENFFSGDVQMIVDDDKQERSMTHEKGTKAGQDKMQEDKIQNKSMHRSEKKNISGKTSESVSEKKGHDVEKSIQDKCLSALASDDESVDEPGVEPVKVAQESHTNQYKVHADPKTVKSNTTETPKRSVPDIEIVIEDSCSKDRLPSDIEYSGSDADASGSSQGLSSSCVIITSPVPGVKPSKYSWADSGSKRSSSKSGIKTLQSENSNLNKHRLNLAKGPKCKHKLDFNGKSTKSLSPVLGKVKGVKAHSTSSPEGTPRKGSNSGHSHGKGSSNRSKQGHKDISDVTCSSYDDEDVEIISSSDGITPESSPDKMNGKLLSSPLRFLNLLDGSSIINPNVINNDMLRSIVNSAIEKVTMSRNSLRESSPMQDIPKGKPQASPAKQQSIAKFASPRNKQAGVTKHSSSTIPSGNRKIDLNRRSSKELGIKIQSYTSLSTGVVVNHGHDVRKGKSRLSLPRKKSKDVIVLSDSDGE